MKNIHIILATCFLSLQTIFGQPKVSDPIPDSLKQLIIGYTEGAIDLFKAELCPQFKDSVNWHQRLVKLGDDLLYPDLNPKLGPYFSYNFEVKRWPEDSPYINFFLVIKKNNIMTRERDSTDEKGRYVYDEKEKRIQVTDTFAKEIPCYKYFPYDERFVVYYDTTKKDLIYFSGNVYQTWLAYKYRADKYKYNIGMAQRATQFRLSQYSTSETQINFIRETDEFYEFSADNTVLIAYPVKVLVRIHKTDPFQFGSTWEMIYYSNTKDVPGNTDQSFYEVKYTRSIRPKGHEELYPKYRKLTKEEIGEVYRKNRFYTDFAPLPEEEPEVIEKKQ